MIDNQTSLIPYHLRFGTLLIPICSQNPTEWVITPFASVVLRVVMVAWIVFSIYIFFRLQRIKKYVSSSEPVEFIVKDKKKKKKKSDKKSQRVVDEIKDFAKNANVIRWAKIVFAVTGIWVLILVLFQGPILNQAVKILEDEKFTGAIEDVEIRFTEDGVANISLMVDNRQILIRSDQNIEPTAELLESTQSNNGKFEGLNKYMLEDQLLPNCLEGERVEVYAKRSRVFYTLNGDNDYYIRFVSGSPSCQKNYIGKCVLGNQSFDIGEIAYYDDESYYCECTVDGLNCGSGEDILLDDEEGYSCRYGASTFVEGETFDSIDGCTTCECTKEGVSCQESSCDETVEYPAVNNLQVPVYYWFVDEPEASEYVYLEVGEEDNYRVYSENPFGESPKTELLLDGGNARLEFSVSHLGFPISTPEYFSVQGNVNFPGLVRAYSPQLHKYIFSRGLLNDGCSQVQTTSKSCVSSVMGGLVIECIASEGKYEICDEVMKTFSFESKDGLNEN